jgi:hypothetical protein
MAAPIAIKKIGKTKAKPTLPVANPPRKNREIKDENVPTIRRIPKTPNIKWNIFISSKFVKFYLNLVEEHKYFRNPNK